MNVLYQLVCGDVLVDKYQGNGLTLTYDSCCMQVEGYNGEPYLSADSICCDGFIHDRVDAETGYEYNQCCGALPFNVTNNVCCGGKSQGPYEWPACCGDNAFNARTHTARAGILEC